MSKVNKKRAKLVEAKVKSAQVSETVVKPAEVAVVEVKPVESIISAFVYPNKGKFEIDEVKVNLNGKDQAFKALTKVKLDISALKLNELVKALFIDLRLANSTKFQFGYKNAYNFAFGLVPKGFNSYKCVIAHHNGDGLRSLIVNANKHFGMGEIEKALAKLSISFENHKTYVKLYLSKENLANVTKACQGLVECSVAG